MGENDRLEVFLLKCLSIFNISFTTHYSDYHVYSYYSIDLYTHKKAHSKYVYKDGRDPNKTGS